MNAIYYPDAPFKSLCIPEILKEIYIDKVFAKLKPCNVILDVGANIGLTAMYLKDFGKTVYAIEPNPMFLDALRQNAKSINIFCCPYAIAESNGERMLYLNDENRTMNSLVWKSGNGTMVQCKTFAQFMTEQRIEEVDFVKLDVEGAEEEILLSEGFIGVCESIKSMLIEFHDRDRVEFLYQHMIKLGYKGTLVQANAMLWWFER